MAQGGVFGGAGAGQSSRDEQSVSQEGIAGLFREEAGSILASLIRQFRDFDLAEEALQDALTDALAQWPQRGVPDNGAAWLLSTARRRAIDRIRRNVVAKNEATRQYLQIQAGLDEPDEQTAETEQAVPEERLRLIFTCCHPALNQPAQVALTLRTLCGLSTPEIARAYLVSEATMQQRLVRAKKKIRDAGIPYEVPDGNVLDERLAAVCDVIYLIFNEGFAASEGESAVRVDLCREAVRLGRILVQLMPGPEPGGLLALMLLHDARRDARVAGAGRYVPIDEQDRSLWNRAQIQEGTNLLLQCLAQRRPGPFQVQAAISAVHAQAVNASQTDWPQIAGLYAALYQMQPSAVVRLNQAVALANAGSVDDGLHMLRALGSALGDYQPWHAAHADLLARVGQVNEAVLAYRRAIDLTANDAQRSFLQQRLERLVAAGQAADC